MDTGFRCFIWDFPVSSSSAICVLCQLTSQIRGSVTVALLQELCPNTVFREPGKDLRVLVCSLIQLQEAKRKTVGLNDTVPGNPVGTLNHQRYPKSGTYKFSVIGLTP